MDDENHSAILASKTAGLGPFAWKSLEAKFRLSGSPFGDFVLQHAPKMFNRNKLS
jgi:hypothetical protein